MIFKSKLLNLTDIEMDLFLYAVNEFKTGKEEINLHNVQLLNIKFVFFALNEIAKKIKPEHVGKLQVISDKLLNDAPIEV